MLIAGLQKLTLLDYPGHIACTVFTGGCNLRCPFCHNASLVLPEKLGEFMSEEEFFSFLRKRQGVLEGVAITGGEPLLQKDMPAFLRGIRELGYSIKLDTNGCYPEKLEEIVSAGLVDRVAMDIKNSPALYGTTVGIAGFDIRAVERSKNFLLEGRVEYEFRTTAVKGLHTEESIAAAAKWIEGAEEYYLQQFKDSGELIDSAGLGSFDEDEMKRLLKAAAEFVPAVQLRGI